MAKKKAKARVKAKKKAAAKPKRKATAKKTPVRKSASRPRPAPKKAAARKSRPAAAKPARSSLIPKGSNCVTPMLVVRDMTAAVQFYTGALGFTLRVAMPGPDGRLMHAELVLNDCVVMLGPESPERGSFAPQGPSAVTLYVFTENVDVVAARAAGMGGNLVQPPMDMFWGDRCALVIDPDGHNWMIATHMKDLSPTEMMAAAEQAMAPPTT